MATEDDGFVQVRLLWIDLDETPIYSTNQAVAQIDQDRIVLTFGSTAPPLIAGATPDERREQAESIGYVPIRPVVRVALTRDRLAETATLLNNILKNFDDGGGQP